MEVSVKLTKKEWTVAGGLFWIPFVGLVAAGVYVVARQFRRDPRRETLSGRLSLAMTPDEKVALDREVADMDKMYHELPLC